MMPTPLLDAFLVMIEAWRQGLSQERTFVRAARLALALTLTPGRRMISRWITSCGRQQRDWSADYKLFSRSPWTQQALFLPVLQRCVKHLREQSFVHVAGDFTHLRKTGRKIPGVQCMRDPMSPPFHVNLIHGLRFLQLAVVLPFYRSNREASPRSFPVLFEEVPALKKPGKKATAQEYAAYAKASKQPRHMKQTLEALGSLRRRLDELGCLLPMLVSLDGGFANRTIFRAMLERITVVCRARKDARLCQQATQKGRFYSKTTFTPEQVRQDESIPWSEHSFFHGGAWRCLRYKQLCGIYWQAAAGRRTLRLIVIAPTPYRLHRLGRVLYRQPAYLLTTDLQTPAQELVQAYLDHWQIEINHRDEKSVFGVGDAQVRNAKSVPRQPAFAVAVYSMILMAACEAYGVERTDAYLHLPKWRPHAKRPSCADIIAQLRREMDLAGHKLTEFAHTKGPLKAATLMAAA